MKVPWTWRLAALLDVAAHAEVAVADGEQRLGDAEVRGRRPASISAHVVDREADPVERVVGARRRASLGARPLTAVDQLGEVGDDDVGAGVAQRVGPGAAVDADDQAEAAGRARPATPETASSTTTARSVRRRRACRRRRRRCRAPACRRSRVRGDVAVDDDVEAVGQPGRLEHGRGVARGRDDGDLGPALGEVVEQRDRAGVRLRRRRRASTAREHVVLAVAEPADGLRVGRVGRVALGQRRCRARRGSRGTPS